MKFASAVVVAYIMLIASCDAYFYTWNAQYQRDQPITCPINDLINASKNWNFRTRLTCKNNNGQDEFINIDSETSARVAVGRECKFSYVCDMDDNHRINHEKMTCGQNGRWTGTLPQCNAEEELTDAILNVFENLPRQSSLIVESSAETEENSGTSNSAPTKSSLTETQKNNRFRAICDAEEMCTTLRGEQYCSRVSPKGFNKALLPKMKKFFVSLCQLCFRRFCSQESITLL